MNNDNLWALMPDMADETFRIYEREKNLGDKVKNTALIAGPYLGAENDLYSLCGNVAILEISGAIDRKVRVSFWTGRPYTAGQREIRESIEAALADPDVSSILLSIDSPGGVVSGTKELADYIASVRGQTPIAAYADGLCASAAFWLAAATGQISRPKPRRLAQ